VSGGRNEASGVAPCLTLFETRGVCTQGGCGFTFTWKCGRAAHHRRGRGDDDYDFPDALDHGYRDVDFDETGEAAAKKWTLQTFVRHAFLCGRGAQGATAATDRKSTPPNRLVANRVTLIRYVDLRVTICGFVSQYGDTDSICCALGDTDSLCYAQRDTDSIC